MNSVGRIVVAQVAVTTSVSLGCLLFDWVASYSALLGGLSGTLPALYAAMRFSGDVRAGANGSGLAQVLVGELGKFVFSIALFSMVFVLVERLNVLTFFGAFVLTQVCYGAVPLIDATRLRRK